jgi:archaeoflavoprotein AfpA
LELRVAWGITGSGDLMPEIIRNMKEIINENKKTKIYIFLSKAAQQVIKWYNLRNELESISNKIFFEIDSNKTEPFYYLPGALQIGKFKLFLVCPATANTVAKIVHGIADTLITNAAAQATKNNVPVYILPVDNKQGIQTTILPDGSELKLTMRKIDIENYIKLSKMDSFHVFTEVSKLKEIITME